MGAVYLGASAHLTGQSVRCFILSIVNQAEPPLIIALDFPTPDDALAFVQRFDHPEELFCKVGMELYYQAVPPLSGNSKHWASGSSWTSSCMTSPTPSNVPPASLVA